MLPKVSTAPRRASDAAIAPQTPPHSTPLTNARQHQPQWLTYNHINRTFLLAMLGLACGAFQWQLGREGTPVPAWMWTLLMLTCYVWPQIAWLHTRRALRSGSPMRAEKLNFLVETFISGMWAATWGFPVWVTVVLFICNSINFVVFHGARAGLPRLVAAFGLGAALVWCVNLWLGPYIAPHPATNLPTMLLCIATLMAYIAALSHATHLNAGRLRRSNRELREQYEEIQALQSLLQEQTLHDSLTGLYNRRHLDDVLDAKIERSRDGKSPLTVMMIDIDNFKLINDSLGHQTGDTALQALARLLLRHTRPQDMAFRYGGEEFVLVMPDLSHDASLQRAESLRAACAEAQIRLSPPGLEGISLSLTLSCGVATFPDNAQNAHDLIACADQALYAAKRQGRNRVQAYA